MVMDMRGEGKGVRDVFFHGGHDFFHGRFSAETVAGKVGMSR